MILLQEMFKKHPQNQYFLVRVACFYHENVRTLDYKGVRTGILCGFEFYRTAIVLDESLQYSVGDGAWTKLTAGTEIAFGGQGKDLRLCG